MNKIYFPKATDDAWKHYTNCPHCSYNWYIRHFKFENFTDKILSEFMYVHYRIEKSNLKKVYYRIFRCLRCQKEFSTELTYVDEQKVNEDTLSLDNQAYQEYLKLKNVSLGKEVKEEDIVNDENLDKIISDLQKGAKI